MQVTLIQSRAITHVSLPEKCSGKYWLQYSDIDDRLVDLIAIEGISDRWILKSNRTTSIVSPTGERIRELEIEPNAFYDVVVDESGERAKVHVEPSTDDRRRFTRLVLPPKGSFLVGRDTSCEISCASGFVSGRHAKLTVEQGILTVEDLKSSNGTFVNGRRIVKRTCQPGDSINIMGLVLIIGAGFIAINNPDGTVTTNSRALVPLQVQQPEAKPEEDFVEGSPGYKFFRSPRFMRTISTAKISIDAPPSGDKGDERPTMLVVGPVITMGIASLTMVSFTIINALGAEDGAKAMRQAIPMVVMSLSMMLGMVLWPTLTRRWEKKNRQEKEALRREKYGAYLGEKESEIQAETERQRGVLFENVIAISNCVHRIRTRDRMLWERVPSHQDFLSFRLGIGNRPLDYELQYQQRKFTMDDDELQDAMLAVAEKPRELSAVPYAISLLEQPIVGIIGDRAKAEALVQGIIVQLAALHSYDELKMVFIYPEDEAPVWGFTRFLPHSWTDDRSVRYLAHTAGEVRNLSQMLEQEIAGRAEQAAAGEPDDYSPHYAFFVLDRQLGRAGELIRRIHDMDGARGCYVVHLCDALHELPKECDAVIEVGELDAAVFDRNDTSGTIDRIVPDVELEADTRELSVLLTNTKLDLASEGSHLPSVITFLEMFEVGKVEHLNVRTRWKESNPVASLAAPVGVGTTGEMFVLDLHEKHHGPHGLIAGMTGSGKSEFIMAYILSMAVNFHPHEVAFVLIDYKGGGMANAFTDLPHVAGTITNLDGNAINRSLMSIQSELRRRQSLFNDAAEKTGTSNIDIYKYQSLYREGAVAEPLPHLLVISDEFAELKTQQPDFMRQLVSAARIGRSLGVHLILATQKPSGVVDDQIWSNSRFRACLKVQERADSMEVIKRPDAAELSQSGRFYLQVGYNELFDIGQSAWPGAPYYPADRVERARDDSVTVVNAQGAPIRQARVDRKRGTEKPRKQLDEVTKYIIQIADEEGVAARALWLDPIPARVYLSEIRRDYPAAKPKPFHLNPLIGMLDDPSNQRQDFLSVPLSSEGNVIVYGSPGSGKTTFMSTLAYSLISSHTPDEVTLYLLDFEAETLRSFARAPHVGGVLFSSDLDRIGTLLGMLADEIKQRRALFADCGGDYDSYMRSCDKPLPSIVLMIHNFAALVETVDGVEDSIAYLSREGSRYGIYVVISASSSGSVRFRIAQNFKQTFVLQMNDETEYSGILGSLGGVVPAELNGRGILKRDVVYEFQVAQVSADTENDFEAIRTSVEEIATSWTGKIAEAVPEMPEVVNAASLAQFANGLQMGVVPIGFEAKSFSPVTFDFRKDFASLVMSADGSGIDTARGIVELLGAQYGDRLHVLDVAGLAPGIDCGRLSSGAAEVEAAIQTIFDEMVRRNKHAAAVRKGAADPEHFDELMVIVLGMAATLEAVSSDMKDHLTAVLDKCDATLGANFCLVDEASLASRYMFDTWATKRIDQSRGIWFGNGFGDQYTLRPGKSTSEIYGALAAGFGWVLDGGSSIMVKLVMAPAQDPAQGGVR